MNPQNSSSLPRENPAPGKLFTRRNFLKLAGASALALPFMKPEEVLATPNHFEFIPGVSVGRAPDYAAAGIPVYSVHVYSQPGHVPTKWPRYGSSRVLLTVYPRWQLFYANGSFNGYDNEFQALAKTAQPGDMISCFQEPENIHHRTAHYDGNGHITGWDDITPWKIKHIQNHMYNIAHNLHGYGGANGNMRVGAIAFHRRSWKGGWANASATDFMQKGLDWYGLDCYRAHISYDDVTTALAAYKAYGGSGASICVPECNAPAYLDSKRQYYFQKIADYVLNHGGPGYRGMWTFWSVTGEDSGPWNTQYVGKPYNKVREGASAATRYKLWQISQM